MGNRANLIRALRGAARRRGDRSCRPAAYSKPNLINHSLILVPSMVNQGRGSVSARAASRCSHVEGALTLAKVYSRRLSRLCIEVAKPDFAARRYLHPTNFARRVGARARARCESALLWLADCADVLPRPLHCELGRHACSCDLSVANSPQRTPAPQIRSPSASRTSALHACSRASAYKQHPSADSSYPFSFGRSRLAPFLVCKRPRSCVHWHSTCARPLPTMCALKSVAVATALLALSHQAAAQQSFSADAAVATDNTGEDGNAPNAPNTAAGEVNGGDTAVLRRQELVPVTSLPRTCDCLPATDLVRPRGSNSTCAYTFRQY